MAFNLANCFGFQDTQVLRRLKINKREVFFKRVKSSYPSLLCLIVLFILSLIFLNACLLEVIGEEIPTPKVENQ